MSDYAGRIALERNEYANECVKLRADLARVTAERDNARTALRMYEEPGGEIAKLRAVVEAALHWHERARQGRTTASALDALEQAIDALAALDGAT